MELKTFRASSMADALAEVKKDLGKDAVILHARTFKAGGVMGVGARTIVEITASNDQRAPGPRARPTRPVASAGSSQGSVPALSPTVAAIPAVARVYASASASKGFEPITPRRIEAAPTNTSGSPARASAEASAPAHGVASLGTRVQVSPVDDSARRSLEDELASIKSLVSEVLQVTRGGIAPRSGGTTPAGPFEHAIAALERHGVGRALIDEVVTGAGRRLGDRTQPELAMDAAMAELASLIPIVRAATPTRRADGRPAVIALIGPTGVGKTTTIAKLAADYSLRAGLRVGLVAADTYRIAAVDQLKTYASIIDVPVVVSGGPEQIAAAVADLTTCDVVLLDTAGRSQRDTERLDELARTLEAAEPDRVHLVLSGTASEHVVAEAAARFGALHPHSVIFTKLDEAVLLGPIVNTPRASGLGLAYLTTGQDVPDNIEHASGARVARMLLQRHDGGHA